MTNSFRTYYVSQIDGNDTNDGLSKSSAFATFVCYQPFEAASQEIVCF